MAGLQDTSEVSSSMMNSMLTAMRSGISAVSRRIGIPHALRNMLEGTSSIRTTHLLSGIQNLFG